MRMIRLSLIGALLSLAAGHAMAQEIAQPRYEALEQQLQILEQRQLDTLERQRMDNLLSTPSPSNTTADRAIRQLDIERRQRELILRGEQERMQAQRERIISDYALPNRRIAPSSVLVVTQPENYGLPHLPRGKYYARLEGRFVVVDAASELVERVLPVQPADPLHDVPQGARRPLSPPVPAP